MAVLLERIKKEDTGKTRPRRIVVTWYSNVAIELFEAFTQGLVVVVGSALCGVLVSMFLILRLELFLIKKIPILNKYISDEKDTSTMDPLDFVNERLRLEFLNLLFHTLFVLAFIFAFGFITYEGNESGFDWDNTATLSFFLGCYWLHIQMGIENFKTRKYWRQRNYKR